MRKVALSLVPGLCASLLMAAAPEIVAKALTRDPRSASAALDADRKAVAARELEAFKSWLDRKHPGYGCDEGPAPFQSAVVQSVYGERRFYYVLTHARGIPPPFAHSLSLVASVDGSGEVRPLDPSSFATYRAGLGRVRNAAGARRAAAAVLILSLGDPAHRRWPVKEERFKVKRERRGWVCEYPYDPAHASQVRFDREGLFAGISGTPPPVP